MHESRRSFLGVLGGSALACGVAGLPVAATSAIPSAIPLPSGLPALPPALRNCLRSVLQALAIARESIEEMKTTREVRESSEFPGAVELNDTLFAIRTQERAIIALGVDADGYRSAAVCKVRDYQHRYRCNAPGQERATLALQLASKELEASIDLAGNIEDEDVYEEAGGVVRGAYWTIEIMSNCLECEVIGNITGPKDEDFPDMDREALRRRTDEAEAKRKAGGFLRQELEGK